jgi:hypothetical protein
VLDRFGLSSLVRLPTQPRPDDSTPTPCEELQHATAESGKSVARFGAHLKWVQQCSTSVTTAALAVQIVLDNSWPSASALRYS